MASRKRTVIKFRPTTGPNAADGIVQVPDLEVQATGIAVNQLGMVVLVDGEDSVGMFPGEVIMAVYQPDGANLIQPVSGVLAKS